MVQFLRSNSVTRHVNFKRTKIGKKCQNRKKTKMQHFKSFSKIVYRVFWVLKCHKLLGHPVPLQPFQSKGEKAFLTSFWQKKKATTVLSPTWEIRLKKMMKMACQIVLHSVAKKWKKKWENISKIGVFLFLTSSDLGGHRVHTFIWIFPPKIAVTL